MELRGFRFHLSTAVLLMLAAGGLVGLNTQRRFGRKEVTEEDKRSCLRMGDAFELSELRFGFPITAYRQHYFLLQKKEYSPEMMAELNSGGESGFLLIKGNGLFGRYDRNNEWNALGVSTNILFLLGSLFLIGFVSEYFVRRNSALRKP